MLACAVAYSQPSVKRHPCSLNGVPVPQIAQMALWGNSNLKSPRMLDAMPSPADSIWMQFFINGTNFQFHRVDNTPLEAILSGTINGSDPLFWNLTSSQPQPGAPPILYYAENIFGNTNPALGTNIPLTWEISLDGGPFGPMTLLPDNTLTATFPPGPHTFQVRITGTPEYHQADGYYHLQLTQCLVPQL